MAGRVGPSGKPDGMMGGAIRDPLSGPAGATGGLDARAATISTAARGTVAASASSVGATLSPVQAPTPVVLGPREFPQEGRRSSAPAVPQAKLVCTAQGDHATSARKRAPRRKRAASEDESGSSDEEGLKWGENPVEADSGTLSQEPETQKFVTRFRKGLWALLDDPNSSAAAYFLAVLIMLLIGVSSISFVLETLPDFEQTTDDDVVWSTIELVCIICFTLEFVGRVISTPKLGNFIKSPLNIIDFLAIVPFYVELAMGSSATGGSSAVFRIIRLVRVFRVFKLSRYLSWVKVFTKAMATSFQPLLMLLVVILIGTVLFSTAIFYAEHGQWDEGQQCFVRFDNKCTPFISIPAAFWWCIITMTTVGYGDEVPITPLGKVIAVITSFCGILVLAVPITVISTNFNEQYDKLKRSRQRLRAQMMLLKNQFKTKRTGLDAMLDEVEELVQRNTMELRKDVEELFEQSALELNEEIKSLVRLAFKQRRKRAQALEQDISLRQPDVLSYWFEDDKTQFRRKWFMSSKEDDEALNAKFGGAIAAAKRGELAGWEGNARSALALVILLDQFGRSVHRGSAEAFAGDDLALKVCLVCMAHGWDKSMSPMERMFLYMPLEHSEDPSMMRLCLNKMAEITEVPAALDFAKTHADILEQFGRYPHRNAVLGRESTQAELDYLKSANTFGQ